MIASRVADALGLSRPAVSEMLHRMEAEGLVTRRDGRRLALTPSGLERARRVVRKHRIVERFLTDVMGYEPAEINEQAEQLWPALTDRMIERIDAHLGHPDRCPHGWPIDTALAEQENADLVALADVPAGITVTLVRLAEDDGELLDWFYREGLVPGAQLEVVEGRSAVGGHRVALGGATRLVADDAAGSLYVRPTSGASIAEPRDTSNLRSARTEDAERSCADVSTGEARYLMAVLDLSQPDAGAPFTQSDLARHLGVSGPTALQMVRRLRSLGLLQTDAVQLTPAGRSAALVLRSRRNAALALVRDVLGLDDERAEIEAAWLAASASPSLGRQLIAWHGHAVRSTPGDD